MSQQIRVLYVNDDLDSLQSWSDVLREQDGLAVLTETNIDDGVNQLSNADVNCVLSDLSVTEETNIDFLKTVRNGHPDLPFILFTGTKPDRTINETIEAGATDYIPKSLAKTNETLLRNRIEQAIANRQTQIEESATGGRTDGGPEEKAEPATENGTEHIDVAVEAPPGYGHQMAIDLEPAPGSSTFIQCQSHNELKTETCMHLLGGGTLEQKNVVLIRYKSMNEKRLARIAERAAQLKLICIGYTQSTPGGIDDRIEVIEINNPHDVTRLGIVITGAVKSWESPGAETVLCFDTLNVLLRYKSVKKVFQFLHILLAKLEEANATAHFHIDHTAEDLREINSLKPIFDNIVKVNASAVHTESEIG